MPWRPLPRIAFAVATYPFATEGENELPLEIGDDLYIIEETPDSQWLRGYLLAPPSLLAGLTSVKGQSLEARVFSGIFPRSCVEIREVLGGESDSGSDTGDSIGPGEDGAGHIGSDSAKSGVIPNEKDIPARAASTHNKQSGTASGGQGPGALPKRAPGEPKPPAPVPMLRIGDDSPTSAAEPLIDEISSFMREWHSTNFHELLLSRQYTNLDKVSQLIQALDTSRRQFLHGVLTRHEYNGLREKTVWDLVQGNKLCGGGVIVRDPVERGRVLTGDDSVVDMTTLQTTMSLLDEPPKPPPETISIHHLMVDVRSMAGSSNEPTTLALNLVNRSIGGTLTTISETFQVEVPAGGTMGHAARDAQMRTLFVDLTSADVGDAPSADSELYLVVKVRATQQVTAVGKPSSRAGSYSQTPTPFSKDKPPSSGGPKASRRSLMWGSTRSAFSRGGAKLDPLSEQPEPQPKSSRAQSRDDSGPPSTSDSQKRRGSIDGSQTVRTTVDRTVGLGVMKLTPIMNQDEETEQVMAVWAPSERQSTEKRDNGDPWGHLARDLLESGSGHFDKSRRAERLQLHLKSFNHSDADQLIRATPTMLSGVCKTSKMGFAGAPTKPRSDIYFTVNEAFLGRQNLLCRFEGSATSIPNTVQAKSLVICLEVRRPSGELIENCIYPSSNSEAVSTWKSFATERGEQWNQTLRLSLDPSDVTTAHVLLTIADSPQQPFAMAYVPLWEQQAFMSDGSHSSLLYKLDEFTQTAQAGPDGRGGYLTLPWSARSDSSDVTGPLATLRTETYLCSTRFSQDRIILGLLKWKEGRREDIPTWLKQLMFVPEIEVVKLLSEVLDSLFGILVEHQGNDEYEDLVFTALVRVLGIVHDRRFNLEPLVDQYAETRFNYPFATPCLVRSFTRLLHKPTEPETARKLRATLKVVRHILKFITHARGQQKVKEADIGITGNNTSGFTRHLQSIFKALDAMMRSTAPVLVGSQTLAVQHFHTWLPELGGLLSTEEILHIAIDFVDSCGSVKGKLVLYKLILIINYSKLPLFQHPEQRTVLNANTARWIAPHWGSTDEVTDQWRDQVRLCCSVLAGQAEHLGPEIPAYIPKIIDSFLAIQNADLKPKDKLSLLFPSSYPFPTRPVAGGAVPFDETLIELSAVLSALSSTPAGMQLELAESPDLGTLLKEILQVHMSILQGQAFPEDWLSLRIYHHKSTMQALQYLATILLDSFLPDPDDAENFDTDLWKMFFTTLLKLVGSESLALETFPEQKRRAVWKIAGDVREHGADLLRRTWEAIGWEASTDEKTRYGLARMGGYQVQYVPTLVGPIVELCLSVHEGLRTMAVEVLQTMIVSEWTLSEDLSAIQTEMIDSLDAYFKDKTMTESILQKLFVKELAARFDALPQEEGDDDDSLQAALAELIATVDEFLDLLVAVHSGDSTATGEASQLINRLRLMEFLRDMQKQEIFVRYVHQLAVLQAGSGNHTEAGLALRLHAECYDWDPIKTTPALTDPSMPGTSHFDRKERIYFDMIKHFEDGEAWSSALAAYKELQCQYENNVFDFAKLARTERAIATIYEILAKTDKLVPKYYKVVFKGLGFAASLREKAFIYEGSHAERTSAFTDRMQGQYPSARILTTGDIDSDSEGQFLVISAVSTYRDLGHHVFQRARVPQPIRDYLLSAHAQVFSVSSKRVTNGPVSEHHAEKTVFTTAESFPTILRRSEIVDLQTISLNAKETGLERIVRKTQEMTAVEKRLADGEEEVAQLLVDAIGVSVNAESENSVATYRQLLPTSNRPPSLSDKEDEDDDFDDEEDEEIEYDAQDQGIRMALVDHAVMIKRCLTSFARSSNPILNKAHEDLYPHFESTFLPEIIIFTPAPVPRDNATSTPIWRRPSPTNESPRSVQKSGTVQTTGVGVVEEAAAAQPVSLKQRGTRLSFLGGKKKETQQSSGDVSHMAHSTNGTGEKADSPSLARKSKEFSAKRTSFFRTPSSDNNHNNSSSNNNAGSHAHSQGSLTNDQSSDGGRSSTWNSDHHHRGGRKSEDVVEVAEKDMNGGHNNNKPMGLMKTGSLKKRLSTLKLGGKRSKVGLYMEDVQE